MHEGQKGPEGISGVTGTVHALSRVRPTCHMQLSELIGLVAGGGREAREGVFMCTYGRSGASLEAQTVKNPPAMQETRVRSLGREAPLEAGMTAHSSIRAWRIPWTEEPGGPQSMGSQSRTRLSDYYT